MSLLSPNDPKPVSVFNPNGSSSFVLTCEHSGNSIPLSLGRLGLNEEELYRHIALDIGAAAFAKCLAKHLDAPLVLQEYSRLVIDCNRPKNSYDSIPLKSDGVSVPANMKLSRQEQESRHKEIFVPFHDTVRRLLDTRCHNRNAAVIALHSFTPVLATAPADRPWDIGLLYNRDNRLAIMVDHLLGKARQEYSFTHNKPYTVDDASDYTLPVHGEQRGIYHLLLEIRNDHLILDNEIHRLASIFGNVLKKVEELLKNPSHNSFSKN